MEHINNNFKQGFAELDVIDMLCSTGYISPRNEKDIDRFDRIYASCTFGTEGHTVNADAIFNKVKGSSLVKCNTKKKNLLHLNQSQLRAASVITDEE